MTNITILYQGGSGGFALYYYLLLSGNYQYTIAETQQLISQQFQDNLKNFPEQWKNKEFWPDNQQLKNQDGSKVFLICNPLFNPDMLTTNLDISDRTHKILLYVDLKLQLRMAYEKQAYWFTKVSKTKFSAPDKLNQYLRQIIISGDSRVYAYTFRLCGDPGSKRGPNNGA